MKKSLIPALIASFLLLGVTATVASAHRPPPGWYVRRNREHKQPCVEISEQLLKENNDVIILDDLSNAKKEVIDRIETDDDELDAFLFSLGCYSGEPITVVSHLKNSCVVSIKDGRYNIDKELAEAIIVK